MNSCVEELSRKDDFVLLFVCIASGNKKMLSYMIVLPSANASRLIQANSASFLDFDERNIVQLFDADYKVTQEEKDQTRNFFLRRFSWIVDRTQ